MSGSIDADQVTAEVSSGRAHALLPVPWERQMLASLLSEIGLNPRGDRLPP
jgi:hypothetical protein